MISIVLALFVQAPAAFSKQKVSDVKDRKGHAALDRFQNALEQDGFDVGIGLADTMDWAEQYCLGKLDSGGYVNKAPYLRMMVPASAQAADCSSQSTACDEVFQLRHDEAIVLIGVTPPPVNYYGYHTVLWKKAYPDTDGPKPRIFATLGDAVNNATVNTIGPTPFNTPVALIFTPDQTTEARVRAALRRAGYQAAIINTLVFPASLLNLGFGETADELRIVMRIGKWKSPDAGKSYMENISETLNVFRVTPRTQGIGNPFPVPPQRVRGTGQTEMDLMNKLDQLRQGIIEANSENYTATDIHTKPNWYEGYDYIQRHKDPGGDVRDAFLLSAGWLPEYDSKEKTTLAEDEFLMVYGPNHVATGKATYMSVNVYESQTAKLSIGQVFDDEGLAGSASPYLPSGDPAADLFYAYKISRNCGAEPNCLPLSGDDYNTKEHPRCVDITEPELVFGLIFRMYLEPATKIGAAMSEILYDRVIKFSPTKQE